MLKPNTFSTIFSGEVSPVAFHAPKLPMAMSRYWLHRISLSQPREKKQPATAPMSDHWLRVSYVRSL